MKKIFFILIFIVTSSISAQVDRILFNYDSAGNQIKRELCINCSSSLIRTSQEEIIKEIVDLKEEDLLKFESEDLLSYYPNPVKEELFLKWELISNNVSKVEIYSLSGQLIKFLPNLEKENSKIISFQEYPSGTYSVLLSYTNGEQKSITIIKQ
ncbi:T9SS type A sorting domain-containing protein [Flavobacterium jejuense]|uniref:T9SS type A sorting domain-containing protein n=1 Tax=Flavobacterium jejuense TaxID=1544455 RepID=A0ABX0IQ61_9FLAO|nr:T9SS type A sorting domain-containing protein [Flavobacterium jejuense]NHN25698.1 T9SS type A sorting domain-containing protein [Flavobacterium jejuense]